MLTNHVRVATLLLRMRLRPSEGFHSPGAALVSWLRRPLISSPVLGRLPEPAKHQVLLVGLI